MSRIAPGQSLAFLKSEILVVTGIEVSQRYAHSRADSWHMFERQYGEVGIKLWTNLLSSWAADDLARSVCGGDQRP